jgi:peptidyl-prolyl cis-trans isomerase B (cyclophilin B)
LSRDPRRVRRRQANPIRVDSSRVDLPGPLAILTNPKVFIAFGVIMVVGMVVGLLPGVISSGTAVDEQGLPQQANELPDAPMETPLVDANGTPLAQPTPRQTVKRYEAAPALAIDPAQRYVATIRTEKGEIGVELFAGEAPQTVNSFVFLAREGYYDNNPVILGKDRDGSTFTAAIGDPTGTGNVRPGYTTPRESTDYGFVKGAVGMGDSQTSTNDGRFWISFADEPALNGKYTIFGRVLSGMDVLESLSQGGRVLSVTVNEG